MHYVKSKSILSQNNGMNLYRGCSHGCIYCDSRSDVYGMGHEFEDIEVKENSLELLKKELKRRPKAMIGTGSMTDPYIPLENHLKYVRKTLELIHDYGFTNPKDVLKLDYEERLRLCNNLIRTQHVSSFIAGTLLHVYQPKPKRRKRRG